MVDCSNLNDAIKARGSVLVVVQFDWVHASICLPAYLANRGRLPRVEVIRCHSIDSPDHHLLKVRHLLGRQLHAEVTPGNHDPVREFHDLLKVVHRLCQGSDGTHKGSIAIATVTLLLDVLGRRVAKPDACRTSIATNKQARCVKGFRLLLWRAHQGRVQHGNGILRNILVFKYAALSNTKIHKHTSTHASTYTQHWYLMTLDFEAHLDSLSWQ